MSPGSPSTSSFDYLTDSGNDHLLSAVAAVTAAAVDDASIGTLVIVVRPEARDRRVLAGGGNGVMRAAMSVAVASGNTRVWDGLPEGDTEIRPISSLPEVVRAAAEGSDVVGVYAGAVRVGGSLECVAFWFETSRGVASLADRRHTLQILAAAAERNAEEAASAPPVSDPEVTDTAAGARPARTFDPNDPDLDAITGLANAERFGRALADFDGDEAALVLIELDDFEDLVAVHGEDVADRVVRIAADRLVTSCRGSDVIARVADHRFAVLFGTTERSLAMQISKRLVATIAEPLDLAHGPESVTATIALAHQIGLVDVDELLELADDAVASGRRSGTGRLVLAV